MLKYKLILIGLFIAIWTWAAINPISREDWLLENILVFLLIIIFLFFGKYFRISNVSYTLLFLYIVLHVVGSHYTYAQVPFGIALQDWFNTTRNMYDRIVHFSFGFLLGYPIKEALGSISKTRGLWGYYLPIDIVLALSAVYEILEWMTVEVVDKQAGLEFLGAQGDMWDAQKDMLMAGMGAVIAMGITYVITRWYEKRHVVEHSG